MAYRVDLTAPAEADAFEAFEHIRQLAPVSAERWLEGLFAAIASLSDMPARCPVIPEADELGYTVRHLVYGRRTVAYRVVFDIQEQSPVGPRVRVLRIRRGSRDALSAEDMGTEH